MTCFLFALQVEASVKDILTGALNGSPEGALKNPQNSPEISNGRTVNFVVLHVGLELDRLNFVRF